MLVLVTGAAGFIGSHLCDRLLADGHEVIGLDNFSTGRAENLRHLQGRAGFQIIRHDICQQFERDLRIGMVYNLACPASPRDYLAAPIATLAACSSGTRNMLELARRNRARFLQASTSETYGDALVHPQPETYWGNVNPVGPRSVYDEGKRYAEALTMAYRRQHGVDTRIARLFNVYGPRMRRGDGRVLPAFLDQVLRDVPLTVFGDGSQTRSFCYVSDIVEGMVRLAASQEPSPINLGSPEEVTVLELARLVQQIAGVSCEVSHCALPKDDPARRRPDITRAKRVLGWEPRVALRQGVRMMLASLQA
ncbi:MAG: SDR family oxidoreductase [Bryobacterales bacterium]|nr:SDR family oxidoreductase [Bryobacterales bacterium]